MLSAAKETIEPLGARLEAPPAKPARGTADRAGAKRIVVSLDPITFDHVALLASVSNVAFAEAVRQLIRTGLAQHGIKRGRR